MANVATWVSKDGEKEMRVDIHVGDTVRVHYKLIEKKNLQGKQSEK